MKSFILYVGAILGNVALIVLSDYWYGMAWFTEWLFGLLTIGLFGLFLRGWKRSNPASGGLFIITGVLLLTINSIFFVQNLPAFICTIMLGLLLIPVYRHNRGGVLAAGGLILLNAIILIEVETVVTMWLLFLVTGAFTLAGFRSNFLFLKVSFSVLFWMTSLVLLLIYLVDSMYVIGLLIVATIALVAVKSYKFSRHSVS